MNEVPILRKTRYPSTFSNKPVITFLQMEMFSKKDPLELKAIQLHQR